MEFQFRHHVIDTDLPEGYYGQTVLALSLIHISEPTRPY